MFTEKYEKYLVLTKEKSTSKIVGAINEVLRVRMYHSRNTLLTKSIMPHPSSIYKLLHLKSVTGVLFLYTFYRKIAQSVNFSKVRY